MASFLNDFASHFVRRLDHAMQSVQRMMGVSSPEPPLPCTGGALARESCKDRILAVTILPIRLNCGVNMLSDVSEKARQQWAWSSNKLECFFTQTVNQEPIGHGSTVADLTRVSRRLSFQS